jgi:hypothetical protein
MIILIGFNQVTVLAANFGEVQNGKWDRINDNVNEVDTLSYNGLLFKRGDLQLNTVEWLQWYNNLTDSVKEMISYEPLELETQNQVDDIFSYNIYMYKLPILEKILDYIPSMYANNLLPTSGYEPAYNPTYWNKAENIGRANCYAYAMYVLCNNEGKLQPGDMSGNRFTSLTKASIIKAAKADGPYLGGGRALRESTQNEKPGAKEYKVALVIAPGLDYHWYIQNKDGYWSHKRGLSKVTNVDADGKKIKDPKTCSRNYGGGLNYSNFCGYYIVKCTAK